MLCRSLEERPHAFAAVAGELGIPGFTAAVMVQLDGAVQWDSWAVLDV